MSAIGLGTWASYLMRFHFFQSEGEDGTDFVRL
jgi:hypothetical protein